MDDYNIDVEKLEGAKKEFEATIQNIESAKESIKKILTELSDNWKDVQFEKYKNNLDSIVKSIDVSINNMNNHIKSMNDYAEIMGIYLAS